MKKASRRNTFIVLLFCFNALSVYAAAIAADYAGEARPISVSASDDAFPQLIAMLQRNADTMKTRSGALYELGLSREAVHMLQANLDSDIAALTTAYQAAAAARDKKDMDAARAQLVNIFLTIDEHQDIINSTVASLDPDRNQALITSLGDIYEGFIAFVSRDPAIARDPLTGLMLASYRKKGLMP